jgi:hypothetical protein
MPKLRPIKRKDLISFLHQLDFTGPYAGGKHEYMQRGQLKVHIPNPHLFLYKSGNNCKLMQLHSYIWGKQ